MLCIADERCMKINQALVNIKNAKKYSVIDEIKFVIQVFWSDGPSTRKKQFLNTSEQSWEFFVWIKADKDKELSVI